LYIRWLEFGTFCPMMRSHGADAPREIYQFGKAGDRDFDAIEKFIKLRYQLLPYIYSTSWDVTANHSSMMRALVMDFANDKNALDINDEFMFGKSILVSPVTTAMYVKPTGTGRDQVMQEDFSSIKTKEVYLPAGTDWYDFWTGEKFTGGKKIMRETPLDLLPLFIKAGSILPLGPTVQYATEKKWDNLVINVYPGANGKFVLYEDENDNYNYEKRVYSTINFTWDDKRKTLTIDDRNGSFPGMLQSRTFQIMMPDSNKAVGDKTGSVAAKLISYSGKKVVAKF
jgi:alpha-D-xyloside xylohydrolase